MAEETRKIGTTSFDVERNDAAPDVNGDRCRNAVAEDAALVRRCIAGEVAAWEELYTQRHPPLLAAIRIILPPGRRDTELVDEMAARVWYTLVQNDGELLDRFDPSRGVRLGTFLAVIARDQIGRYFRSEARRRTREAAAGGDHFEPFDSDRNLDLSEFLAMLTPGERLFAAEYLRCEEDESWQAASKSHSPANIWQITRRIRRKLTSYLRKN